MTTIYVIPNLVSKISTYICDSQATIDSRPIDPKTGQPYIPASQCSVGTQTDADNKLASNQSAWLAQQSELFNVNLQTAVEGGVVWTLVDLNTEPENTDRQYFVYDPTDGLHEPATGLDAAKTVFAQIQQEYLVFTGMDKYIEKTEWNPPPQ
jgi:hypothetical protein